VRVVLNKADQVDMSQLMRVYGALMWSLGKVFNTPEVCRVYVGSFNTEPISTAKNPAGVELFRMEQEALVKDLREVPHRSCDRKVNEFVKRVRAAHIHVRAPG
jgi:EH domain-containing protein 1